MRANLLVLLLCFWLFQLEANAAAIHDAVKKSDIAGIVAAIAAGADVNESDGLVTPLYLSAIRGNAEAVKLLIERRADVNLPTEFGMPLHGAATRDGWPALSCSWRPELTSTRSRRTGSLPSILA